MKNAIKRKLLEKSSKNFIESFKRLFKYKEVSKNF